MPNAIMPEPSMPNSRENSESKQNLINLISKKIAWDDDIACAFEYACNINHLDKSLPRSIDVALRILKMGSDKNTVIATLLSDPQMPSLDFDVIETKLGKTAVELTQGVNRLDTLQNNHHSRLNHSKSPEQAENLRRLLMAIISDVRVMVIKLCYRVERLKLLKHLDYDQRRLIAQETIDIFAPLANRLGMGLIKWEWKILRSEHLNLFRIKRLLLYLKRNVAIEKHLLNVSPAS